MEKNKIVIKNYLKEINEKSVQQEIITGLNSEPKYISSKFFYDKKGSELFERITQLPEYYPTRTEKSILVNLIKNLDVDFKNINIIELGSGDHTKISMLLNQIPYNILETITYYPIDISESAILKSIKKLLDEYPSLEITGIIADFLHQLHSIPVNGKNLVCFLGSTLGNLNEENMVDFFNIISSQMNIGDDLLIGMDMVKDIEIIEKAYNDNEGVTAEFNENILNVVNEKLNADFDLNKFKHIAFYSRDKQRIEMHLEALCDMNINLKNRKANIIINKGEKIHTENSHKFTEDKIEKFAKGSGLNLMKIIYDDKKWFSLVHYKKLIKYYE